MMKIKARKKYGVNFEEVTGNNTLRKKFNLQFLLFFYKQVLTKFSFHERDWVQGYTSMQFLGLSGKNLKKMFGNSDIRSISFAPNQKFGKISKFKNIMTTVLGFRNNTLQNCLISA